MDKLHLMSTFVAVGEEESFAKAARRLRLSPPAVTRAIAALEVDLGVKLLNRTTRYVRVTDAGQRYLDDARRILGDISLADEAAAGINAAPKGQLTITAPVLFGKMFVTPGMVGYLQQHPDVEIAALFLDRVVNLVEEGVDVAVRIGPLPDSSLKALRVGEVRRVVCASTAYLSQYGAPRQPAELADHTIIASTSITFGVEWRFDRTAQTETVRLRPRLTVSSNDAAIEAMRAGLGITRLMSYQIASLLDSGECQIILADHEPPPLPIHILHRESKYGSAKVRSFVDWMAAELRAHPGLHR